MEVIEQLVLGGTQMDLIDQLVSGKELESLRRKRVQMYIYEKFEPEVQSERENEGWLLDKTLKNHVRMKREKPLDEQYKDELWGLMASIGFNQMNKDRCFTITFGVEVESSKQIDVFAVDEETVLFFNCLCSQSGKISDFKKEIESFSDMRNRLFAEIKKDFPNRKLKYILATKNYDISDSDKARMKELSIHHFDENAIRYFTELTKHLGECARFQLLGNIFEGQKINSLENRIPAIEGKMGGYTYYSFSIEPEKLLKIAYVLHRNEANSDMMPTYQRIIKKNRLKAIQEFVDGGGFFPNSLIISIDSKKEKPRFDLATPQLDSAISKIGLLHLPQVYHSAYIIDGQHRLYGYANSKYAATNSIPVVAFFNLKPEKQVELFMEINENQKSVSKNLQNTLNADLLWESSNLNKRRQALRLNIAQKLGESQSSPLYGRINIGENEMTPTCCITIETIELALKSTNFLSKFDKNNILVEEGTFDTGGNSDTRNILLPFLTHCCNYIKVHISEEWEKGDQGLLTINNTIYALIKIFNDIVNHLVALKEIDPKRENLLQMAGQIEYYIAPIVDFFNDDSEEERKKIRTFYGSGGRNKTWRTLQQVVCESRSDFQPEGLEKWIKDNTKQYNVASFEMIQELEQAIREDFSIKLQEKYGEKWLTVGLPPKVYNQANNVMGKHNYNNSLNGTDKSVTLWDCVSLSKFKDIATYGRNWSELFEVKYTRPEEKKLPGGKSAKTEWINILAGISKNKSSTYSVTEEEYIFLKSLYDWIIS